MAGRRIGVGLYGDNGHQVHGLVAKSAAGRLIGVTEFAPEKLDPMMKNFPTLDEMLRDPEVELVALCSPRRRDQAADAIRSLRAGKHVYAEKPCAMDERDLDAIIEEARKSGRSFHEMAGTAFGQPYLAMRELVRTGTIGEVIQVTAEKSYPYHGNRPQDEDTDGGLIGQNAIHALRFVEHVAGAKIKSLTAVETTAGNPVKNGGLRMASVLALRLENGGLASITANYLNPHGTGTWGYESLRIFGTLGMVESLEGGARTRLIVGDEDRGPIDVSAPVTDYFERFLRSLVDGTPMPLSLEDELSPTRWAIRARNAAKA